MDEYTLEIISDNDYDTLKYKELDDADALDQYLAARSIIDF